ncbi:MAG: bacteriorhodopsin [Nostoc sp.]|uniref:bacteriorhodopsin n=1 Tax=Nostoc sp. TaxID=1180 RepID=UPI002FFB8FFD
MTQFWLWVGFIGMVIGSVYFGLKATTMRRKEGMEFPLESLFITLWAAAMYLTMILGETVLRDFNGQSEVFVGRYLDWVVTTPLLLLELGVIAGLRPKLIVGVIGADIFMILTGLIATLARTPNNYLWYIISSGAFLAILASLLTEFSVSAKRRNGKVNKLFQTLRNVLIVLWICYPIVWIFGPEGFRAINVGVETGLYAILDLCAKVGFGFILTSASNETLAQASNSDRIMEAVHSYMHEQTEQSPYR